MSPNSSPRLPGVSLLQTQATNSEYSRWRRNIKYVLQGKGTWKYCNGKCPMPMPEAGATSPTATTANIQPSLLEERRSWVKQDREVKLDIFLSLTDEVMQEVFEVGPPLPPSNLNAQELLQALDKRFAVFKFEPYHHAFCHFLNLHIDQYPSIEDFNQEFLATLEDLLDHGHPLSNIQACSAYFAKLRCTQNPWVAKKLEEWDTQTGEIECIDLLKDSPPRSIIHPLVPKASQTVQVESIPEEYLDNSSTSESDFRSEKSIPTTVSSASTHSRKSSETAAHSAPSEKTRPQRPESTVTRQSLEITIHASSEDIAEINAQAFHKEIETLPAPAIPERGSSIDRVPGTSLSEAEDPFPEWLVSKKSVARRPPPPHDRPLPPLPPQAASSFANTTAPTPSPSCPQIPPLHLETTHPTLLPHRAPSPPELYLHPALRPTPSQIPSYFDLPTRRPSTCIPNLVVPWPSTPDARPHTSRASLPSPAPPAHDAAHTSHTSLPSPPPHTLSTSSSELSLPLQGTTDSAWDYLYEAKGGYLVTREKTRPRVERWSGESETGRRCKKRSWGKGVGLKLDLARFSAGRGVREMI